MNNKKHNWTQEQLDRLRELWKAGYTKYVVAEMLTNEFGFNCTHHMVSGRVSKMFISRKNHQQYDVAMFDNRRKFLELTDFGAAS